MTLTVGRKVLVKNVNLQYSDYRNLDGEILELHGDYATVLVPKAKLAEEDLRDLRKIGDRAVITVKLTNLV